MIAINTPPLEPDTLDVVFDCVARTPETHALASKYLDTALVDVLQILGFDREYTRARGSFLFDASGRAYLDLHTGEGFASLGHNHPDVRAVLMATLEADLVDGVQFIPRWPVCLRKSYNAGSFFVTRAKSNTQVRRRYSRPIDRSTGLVCDQTVVLTGYYTRKGFDSPLRRRFDPETGKTLVFLSNNLRFPP